MKAFPRQVFPVLLALGFVAAAAAQPPYPPPLQAFGSIVHQPPQASSFTLDRSMLTAADGLLNGIDPEGRAIAAGLNSITFSNFHYRDFASYDPGALSQLDAGYEAAGYRHLVNANTRGGASMNDVWLRFQGAMVTNVVVLQRGERNMSAISVDCNLRPLDLLHLSGHFGIPKVDESAVMVPAPPSGSVPSVATGPIIVAPNASAAPSQNAPVLKHHSQNDPQ